MVSLKHEIHVQTFLTIYLLVCTTKTLASNLNCSQRPNLVLVALTASSFSSFFFLSFFIFFNLILFLNFTILYWFCQISKWICPRYTWVPHPEPSSLLPPHTIPLGRPSAPAPSIQHHASNLDWRLVSYMILYVFQCHSPKSSQKTVLYISVSFAVSYTGLLLPSF